MKALILLASLCWFIFSCSPSTPSVGGASSGEKLSASELGSAFFDHYQKRDDWTGFLERYDENVEFIDVILRMKLEGVEEFAAFYNWPDTGFQKHPDFPSTLVLEELTLNDSTAVGRGYFNPFYYRGILYDDMDHMRFTMSLTFNEAGKIVRHVDFIEYPPEILQSVAERLLAENE